ncbi:MAG: lysine exporter protein LysE/YggA [Xanthobacteraceae bacterium]|nr:MAG: lysine exporter protein LysE/YggA [Xanthobacteraceae bacterium]
MQDPLLFTLAVIALLATPGPTNTLLATSGALSGFRRSLPLIGAEMLHLVLGQILLTTPLLNSILRLAVGAYLLVAALRLWQRRDDLAGAAGTIGFGKVFVTTLLNPKAAVFAFVVLPLSQPAPWLHLAAFVLLIVAAASAWILLGASIARSGAARRGVSRAAAAALALFAGLIATG